MISTLALRYESYVLSTVPCDMGPTLAARCTHGNYLIFAYLLPFVRS